MDEYDAFPNNQLIDLIKVQTDSQFSVLEIGCHVGENLKEIKNRFPNSILYGCDINKDCIDIAKYYCNAFVTDIQELYLPFQEDYFDYIIFGDVLEHLRNPQEVLQYCKRFLKMGGSILISVPNIQHISVIRGLLNNSFTYQNVGVLDRTHVHFFAYNDLIEMLTFCDLEIVTLYYLTQYDAEDEHYINELLRLSSPYTSDLYYKSLQYLFEVRKKS